MSVSVLNADVDSAFRTLARPLLDDCGLAVVGEEVSVTTGVGGEGARHRASLAFVHKRDLPNAPLRRLLGGE